MCLCHCNSRNSRRLFLKSLQSQPCHTARSLRNKNRKICAGRLCRIFKGLFFGWLGRIDGQEWICQVSQKPWPTVPRNFSLVFYRKKLAQIFRSIGSGGNCSFPGRTSCIKDIPLLFFIIPSDWSNLLFSWTLWRSDTISQPSRFYSKEDPSVGTSCSSWYLAKFCWVFISFGYLDSAGTNTFFWKRNEKNIIFIYLLKFVKNE